MTFGSKYAMGSLDEDDQIASEICGQVQDVTQDVEYLKIGWEKMTAEYQGSQSRFTTIEERLENMEARFETVDQNVQQMTQIVSRMERICYTEKLQGKAIATSSNPSVQVSSTLLEVIHRQVFRQLWRLAMDF